MRILSADEYSYYKEALRESKVLVEDVYSRESCYNLRGISPMIAAVFLKIASPIGIETQHKGHILDREKERNDMSE